ncbi:MAG: hypothetical protein E6J80_13145 [Deltaproteobacteria bacterium]|nr:MAG: hypothetical protein E6J80_13145 [Deltaproteobacteria bacterium]
MNWNSLLSALVGGLVGGGIPAVMTYLGSRHERARRLEERQWADAEVLADVRRLLYDVDPTRRGANVDTRPGAEDALWTTLRQRCDDVQRRLLVLYVGHPSAAIQSSAEKVAAESAKAVVMSEWHVHDLLKKNGNDEQFDVARKCHETALASTAELERLVRATGAGNGRTRRRGLGGKDGNMLQDPHAGKRLGG